LSANEVISKIFPGQSINQRILEEINLHIDKFIEERKNITLKERYPYFEFLQYQVMNIMLIYLV